MRIRCLLILMLSLPNFSKASFDSVIKKIVDSLESNLNYIFENYEEVNDDCVVAVIIAGVILDDIADIAGPYQDSIKALKSKTEDISSKSAPLLKSRDPHYWEELVGPLADINMWKQEFRYKLAEFEAVYPEEGLVQNLLASKRPEYCLTCLSDTCLGLVINSTLALKPQASCSLSPECQKFIDNLEGSAGYETTHKLFVRQVARLRKCKMDPTILATNIKKACTMSYAEAVSVERFLHLDGYLFDLLLEQILFCGYEGFADFLKMRWLDRIIKSQHDTGCFPSIGEVRQKRDANTWKDGCVDHTTGLGAAVLSLYLNYIVKNADSLVFTW